MVFLRQYPALELSDPYYSATDADTESHRRLDEPNASGIDWKLSNCCGTYEIAFLCFMAGYLVVICILWNTFIMKPLKLIAVFVHGMFFFSTAKLSMVSN